MCPGALADLKSKALGAALLDPAILMAKEKHQALPLPALRPLKAHHLQISYEAKVNIVVRDERGPQTLSELLDHAHSLAVHLGRLRLFRLNLKEDEKGTDKVWR